MQCTLLPMTTAGEETASSA